MTNSETGKIQNGTIMNNPLSSIGKGHFSLTSRKNKDKDLERIIDRRSEELTIFNQNKISVPNKAFVINLKEREDRWERFCNINRDLFGKLEVERFEAIQDKDVSKAIFSSHVGCLEKSFPAEKCVLVLEDDCILASGWYEKLEQCFLDLPKDWDVLIGNHYFYSSIEVLTDNLAKPIGTASTANFVVYNQTSLEKIRNDYHLRQMALQDIDHFLTSDLTSINNYTSWPMLSREFFSMSDHRGKARNMELRVREHAHMFPFIDSESYYPSIDCW